MINNTQIKILKRLYPDKQISHKDFRNIFGISMHDSAVKELSTKKLIKLDFSRDTLLEHTKLTEQGKAYVEECKNERIRYWIPILTSNVIAFAALIVAILAYIKQ